MGGEIDVESVPKKGSNFYFNVILDDENELGLPPPSGMGS
jgi:signal transduction histidine kinase